MPAAKDIFLDALDLPVAQRRSFIEQACAGDPHLRQRVDALLDAHGQADRVIVEPTAYPWAELDALLPRPDAPEAPGAVIGDYVIERVLGEGGFGAVYLARQEIPVQRRVALKIMRPGMDSREFNRRFELERQALAVMDHPGIAKVFDAGETPSGRPYFAMEYVDGLPITDFCDRHRLSIDRRLDLFQSVCLAVQHAHAKGMIHRDLKPSNVLVTLIDGQPAPKIIDFGIAKAADDKHHLAADLTRPQQIIGTPQYMAPEQAMLNDVDVDTRADVYGLGAILYELLTGTPVFAAERLRNLRPSQLEKIICEEEPPRPSVRVEQLPPDRLAEVARARAIDSPGRLMRTLVGDLDWICMRALEKDRARRYPAALSLAADVRRYVRDEPVEACPPTLNYRFQKFARRHRVEFAAAATVALALLAFALGSAWFAFREHRAKETAQAELARANALTAFSQDILAGIDPAEARGMDTALLRKILDKSVARVDAKLADQPKAAAAMLNAIGYAHLQVGHYDDAERLFRESIKRGSAALGMDHDLVMQATENLAAVLVDTNRYDAAMQMMQELLARRRRVLGAEDRQTLLTASNLATIYERTGRYQEGKDALTELVAIRTRLLGPDHLDTLTAMNNLANCLDNLGEFDAALQLLQKVLDGQIAQIGEDHPKTLHTLNNIASAYKNLDQLDKAREVYERTLRIKQRVLGPDDHSTIITAMNLASVHLDQGRLDDAEAMYLDAVARLEGRSGPGDPRIAAYNGLGLVWRKRGDAAKAEPYVRQAVEAARQSIGARHPTMITLLANLASVQMEARQFADAEASARQAIALAGETVGANHRAALNPRRLLARALAAQERFDEAGDTLAAAVEEISQWPGNTRDLAPIDIVKYYDRAGQTAKADPWRPRAAAATTQPATLPTAANSVSSSQ